MRLSYIQGFVMTGGTKMRTKTWCLICIFVLFFVASGCSNSQEQKALTDPLADLSITQKYEMLEDAENWYYFDDGDDGIYRINKKEGVKELVYSDKIIKTYDNANRIWLYNDYIYYVNADWGICRVKTSGQDHSVLLNAKQFWEYDEQPVSSLTVIDNKLFIQMTFPLYCFDMETKTTTQIAYDARQIGISGKDLYFCGRDCTINRMNVHDHEPQAVLQSQTDGANKEEWTDLYKNFIFVDGVMYYYKRNPDGLYRYQNNESRLVSKDTDIHEFSLFEHDGKLYFIVQGDEQGKLMQYDPGNEKTTEILTCNNFNSKPKIIDGYFYYLDLEGNVEQLKMEA